MEARNDEIVTLPRSEVASLVKERLDLLRIAGAAAAFVAELDTSVLPEDTYKAAALLSEFLNAASDETLQEALDSIEAGIERRRSPR